jgi:uncharacterized protein (TIGR03083 family)
MQISPRYDGPPILDIPGTWEEQLAPLERQRRRMETTLAGLSDEQWHAQSRCAEWTVQGVISHLTGVNTFWAAAARAGVAGTPTRFLASFDPAATPAQMVASLPVIAPGESLEKFAASNSSFLATMERLSEEDWAKLAEAPPGHVPLRLMSAHALWDSWVHERDIAVPLGLTCPLEADELSACLKYASAISPSLALGFGIAHPETLAVDATDPAMRFAIEVTDQVRLRDVEIIDDGTPCLTGVAAELIDCLSIRAPLPASAPAEWRTLLSGLATAFDTPDH